MNLKERLEKRRAYRKMWEAKNPIKVQEYEENRREKRKAYMKEYLIRRNLDGYQKRYAARNRLKVRAKRRVQYLVDSGKLIKPIFCERCYLPGNIIAHHKSYAKKNWDKVDWLCKPCHYKVHHQ